MYTVCMYVYSMYICTYIMIYTIYITHIHIQYVTIHTHQQNKALFGQIIEPRQQIKNAPEQNSTSGK